MTLVLLMLSSLASAQADPALVTVDPWVAATPYLAASALLLLLSGFFSGSETALFSLQPLDRKHLESEGNRALQAFVAKPRSTLATLLIGNELTNVTLSSVTAGLVLLLFPDSPWLNVVGLTPVVLVFGEVMPKVVALRWNRRLAPIIAVPLSLFSTLVAPVRWILTHLADATLVLTGGSTAPRQAELREAQFRTLIDEGREAGNLLATEQEMLHKVFEFGDMSVHRLMTPRPDIASIRLTTPWEELLDFLRTSGVSRVPVWHGRPDNFVGVLVVKQLLPLLSRMKSGGRSPSSTELRDLLLPCRFVPTTKRAEDMLREFRTERYHLAIVVDEHGNIVGLVTLDDLLRELVGELLDETDDDGDPEVTAVGSDIFTVKATIDVQDFADRFGVTLPAGEYTTVGGFILDQLGEVPDQGAKVLYEGLWFVVTEVEDRRVMALSVGPADAPVPELGETIAASARETS